MDRVAGYVAGFAIVQRLDGEADMSAQVQMRVRNIRKRGSKMRGIEIEEPITIKDLAEACKLSVSYLRQFVADGFLRPAKAEKKQPMVVTGYVPITKEEWRTRLVSSVQEDRQHMIGVGEGGDFLVLVGAEIKRQPFDSRIAIVDQQCERVRQWTSKTA